MEKLVLPNNVLFFDDEGFLKGCPELDEHSTVCINWRSPYGWVATVVQLPPPKTGALN